jgi:hypothetical protein
MSRHDRPPVFWDTPGGGLGRHQERIANSPVTDCRIVTWPSNEQLQREDMGELVVVNEATGEHTNLPLTKAKTG